MKAIGYSRVSTEEQGKTGISPEVQDDRILKYAAWKGIENVVIMAESPISGSTELAARPVGSEILKIVAMGEVTDILCTKLDRLFRDLKDSMINIFDWEDKVVLHLVDEGGAVDTSTPDGFLQVGIKALFAAYEVRQIRFRTRLALQHKKATGQVYGPIPYGYERGDNKTLVVHDAEMSVVNMMRSRRQHGRTLQGIADQLNLQGIAAKGGGIWHPSTVKSVLKNDLHASQGEEGKSCGI